MGSRLLERPALDQSSGLRGRRSIAPSLTVKDSGGPPVFHPVRSFPLNRLAGATDRPCATAAAILDYSRTLIMRTPCPDVVNPFFPDSQP